MRNSFKRVISLTVGLLMVVGLVFVNQYSAFADTNVNVAGNGNLPMYRQYDLAFADVEGIENFRNISREVEMNGFAISENEATSTVLFKDKIEVYTETDGGKNRELKQLMELVFDKVEGKVISIYYPTNTLEQAIATAQIKAFGDREKMDKLNDTFNITGYEYFCLLEGACEGFEGIKENENRNLNNILLNAWEFNTYDNEDLKAIFGIDDNYIKYYLETIPNRVGIVEAEKSNFNN